MNFADFEQNGFGILENFLDDETVLCLRGELAGLKPSNSVSRKNETIYGVRNLLNLSPVIREFSKSERVRKIAEKFLGQKAKVVRAIFFDKTPDANWKVPWHQDLTIAVRERRDARGFSAWTRKAGIEHVQPPVEILEKMITLRFHLDDADETNGALRVLPGSHQHGLLSDEAIQRWKERKEAITCSVPRGGALLMCPLLLHASSVAMQPSHRRVLHLEYSAMNLPGGLVWDGS